MDQKNRILLIKASAVLAIIVAFSVMAGWFFHISLLKTFAPGFASMKFNTALCFVLTGLALFLSANIEDSKPKRIFTDLFAIIALSIALLTLFQYGSGIDLHIDDFFIKDYDSPYRKGRMAPFSAAAFILINGGLLLSQRRNRILDRISQALLHGCTLIGILTAFGYVYGIPSLYKWDIVTSIALHTSILFIILSVTASFLQPSVGITGLFTGNRLGNQMARKLFPTMVLVVMLLGAIRLRLHRHQLISVEFGGAIMIIGFLLVLLHQIRLTAAYLNKIDQQKADAETKLQQTNANLEQLVTQRTKALSEASRLLKIATEGAEIGIWERNYIDDTITGNDIYYSSLGLPPDTGKLKAEQIRSMVDSSNVYYYTDDFIKQMEEDEDIDLELLMNTPHKGKRYFRFKGVKFFDEGGKLIKMIGAQWDITDFKETENKLKESLSLSKQFIEEAPTSIAMFDTDMKYVAASRKWYKDYNLSDTSIIGKSHYEVFPEIGDEWKKVHQEVLKGIPNKQDEAYFKRADGTEYWLAWDIRPWYISENVVGGILMHTINITERKIAEQKLIISERAFRSNFEYAGIGMSLINLEGKWLKVNSALCNIVGYLEDELMKLTFKDITHPDDLEIDLVLFRELTEGTRDYYQINKRYIHKNGNIVYIILSASVVREVNGNILHFITQIVDITQQKLAEQKLNEILQLTENQNERLKNFANIVSHNLRTHSGNLKMLNEFFFEEHPEYKELEIPKMITMASNNLMETVAHLSEIAILNTNDYEELVPVNLSETLHKAVDSIVALAMSADVRIINEVTEDTNILGIPAYVDSVVLNFLTNAIKYRSNERESYVKLSLSEKDGFTVLKVEDNGQGIDLVRHGSNLFGMYKTFHKHEDSKGVGLFITKNQVETMGGHIEVESEVNIGTTFKIYFKKAAV